MKSLVLNKQGTTLICMKRLMQCDNCALAALCGFTLNIFGANSVADKIIFKERQKHEI
jgi:hypothetical protein